LSIVSKGMLLIISDDLHVFCMMKKNIGILKSKILVKELFKIK